MALPRNPVALPVALPRNPVAFGGFGHLANARHGNNKAAGGARASAKRCPGLEPVALAVAMVALAVALIQGKATGFMQAISNSYIHPVAMVALIPSLTHEKFNILTLSQGLRHIHIGVERK